MWCWTIENAGEVYEGLNSLLEHYSDWISQIALDILLRGSISQKK